MGSGSLDNAVLQTVLDFPWVHGDVAEIGVYKGSLFERLVRWSHRNSVMAHAFDSFQGMDEPGPHDASEKYPRGHLSVGGVEKFVDLMNACGLHRSWYKLWPGFIPLCFRDTESVCCQFIYIDLDHYAATIGAIDWAVAHISPGGVIGFDDWFPHRDVGASLAIKDASRQNLLPQLSFLTTNNNQVFFRVP